MSSQPEAASFFASKRDRSLGRATAKLSIVPNSLASCSSREGCDRGTDRAPVLFPVLRKINCCPGPGFVTLQATIAPMSAAIEQLPSSQPAPAQTPQSSAPAPKRIMAIDALRGFDMFWILGADAFVRGLEKINGGPVVAGLAAQLEHKDWRGFALYDLIFPLFVFIVGVSLVFSLTKSLQQDGPVVTRGKIFR